MIWRDVRREQLIIIHPPVGYRPQTSSFFLPYGLDFRQLKVSIWMFDKTICLGMGNLAKQCLEKNRNKHDYIRLLMSVAHEMVPFGHRCVQTDRSTRQ